MGLSVCGSNHKTASIEDREPFQLTRAELPEAVLTYKELSDCEEAVIVATCNRMEFYQFTPDKCDQLPQVIKFYAEYGVPNAEKLRQICYCRQKTTVARHLFGVASGLDSMVLGEDQVFHQLKEAYSAACSVGGPGTILHKIFHLAFQVGKRVRNVTSIGSGPRSVPGAALEMLKGRMNGRAPKSVLVCGVNEMTEIILDGLTRWGVSVYLANRTVEKAEKLAAAFKAKVLSLGQIGEVIPRVEAVFSATAAQQPIIHGGHFKDFVEQQNPLFLIDLALPRDISPELRELLGVILLDLEDVRKYLDHSESIRAGEIPQAKAIIEEQVSAYSIWRAKERQRTKVLKMHRKLNQLRKEELERFREGFHLSEYRALDAFSQSLVRDFMRLLPEVLDSEETIGKKSGEAEDSAEVKEP